MRPGSPAGTRSRRPSSYRRVRGPVCAMSAYGYDSTSMTRVVIVGGGFGGLNAARALAGADLQVTLLDRHNYHLFQPLLYQVATASLSPGDVASPIRWILRRQANVEVLL